MLNMRINKVNTIIRGNFVGDFAGNFAGSAMNTSRLALLSVFILLQSCTSSLPTSEHKTMSKEQHEILFANSLRSSPVLINDNGGWCWYQDERVIIHDGKLYVASVANIDGPNGATRSGDIEVVSFSVNDMRKLSHTVLHDGLEDDDHNVPALIALPNNDILAVYSKHNTDRFIRYRIHSHGSDANVWQPEVAMKRKDKITYANLLSVDYSQPNLLEPSLKDANYDAKNKQVLYNFYRGINFNPTYDVSYDNGQTWTEGQHFIQNKGRPYVKYANTPSTNVHFVTTEQHPRVFNNSIYHGIFAKGIFYDSSGKPIHDIANGPIQTEKLTKVFQGGPDKVAWTTDLHVDEQGRPYTVFSVQVNDANKDRHKGQRHGDDMRYYFAKWLDEKWQVNEIAYAGSRLYDREQDYTGLAALDPNDPNVMVISTNVDPATGDPLISQTDGKQHWELFIGNTSDNGKTWSWQAVTKDSDVDNLRPVIPSTKPDDDKIHLLWMQGKYTSYTQMNTNIMYKALHRL